jgi:hypothetical protein
MHDCTHRGHLVRPHMPSAHHRVHRDNSVPGFGGVAVTDGVVRRGCGFAVKVCGILKEDCRALGAVRQDACPSHAPGCCRAAPGS